MEYRPKIMVSITGMIEKMQKTMKETGKESPEDYANFGQYKAYMLALAKAVEDGGKSARDMAYQNWLQDMADKASYKIFPELEEKEEPKTKVSDLGNRIRGALALAGLSQSDAARLLDMSRSNFNNKLQRGSFSREELAKIAEICGGKYLEYIELPDGTKL